VRASNLVSLHLNLVNWQTDVTAAVWTRPHLHVVCLTKVL
jgi:hypothetical protein